MRHIFVAAAVVLMLALEARAEGAPQGFACTKDIECGGDLVCQDGRCVPENAGVSAPQTAVFGAPVDAAKGAIMTSAILDLSGYVFFIVGGVISATDAGAGLGWTGLGAVVLSVGSVVGSSAYSARTQAYRDAGFDVSLVPSSRAWTLTGWSIACAVVGTGLGIAANSADSFGLGLAGFAVVVTGGILEIVNATGARAEWAAALDSARRIRPATAMVLTPALLPVAGTTGVAPGVALALRF